MKTVVKQTIFIFFVLIVMTLTVAGVFFVFVKKIEAKNRAFVNNALVSPTAVKTETAVSSTLKNEKNTATTTEKIKETATTTPKEENKKEDAVVKEESKTETATGTVAVSKDKVLLPVPFTSQAPYGDWADMRQEAGCEEASLLMAAHWITGKDLTPAIALKEILAMSEYETEKYGNYYDTSAADTLKLFKEYFGYNSAYVKYDVGVEDIKKALKDGNVVQVPVVGTLLGNPYFTPPGPPVHQLLIIGYDDGKREFIANDPGTRHGAGYRYKYSVMSAALRDYPTGENEVNTAHISAMIVISKNQ